MGHIYNCINNSDCYYNGSMDVQNKKRKNSRSNNFWSYNADYWLLLLGRYIPGFIICRMVYISIIKHLQYLLQFMDSLLQFCLSGFLLSPRDYLSSIMKISVIALLAIGVIIVAPEIKMPAFTEFGKGGGPIIPGKLFPIPFYYNCMWCNFRISFTGKFRNNSKNDNEGIEYKVYCSWFNAYRRCGKHYWH